MDRKPNLVNQLIQDHLDIEKTLNRITDLSEDLGILFEVKNFSLDFTPYQCKFISKRRLDLRQNIVHLQEWLQDHYRLEEKVLRPILGNSVRQTLESQHRELLSRLSDTNELLLSLSPVGILFNGRYLQNKINTLCQSVGDLSSWEESLLELADIYAPIPT